MMQIQYNRLFSLGLFPLALVACASGPKKPDPLPPAHAEHAKQVLSPDVQESDVQKPAARESTEVTIPFGAGMTRPAQIAGPTPSLPPEAIANHVTGIWIGRCILTKDGSVKACEVVKGLPYSNEHIIQVLSAQKYTPVIFEGKPQSVWYTFKITFIEPVNPQQS